MENGKLEIKVLRHNFGEEEVWVLRFRAVRRKECAVQRRKRHNMFKNIEYKYIVAIIYTCILFLDRVDMTIVNVALPSLANYFHIHVTQTEWISNAFLLALAISIPISGWVGDRFGIKQVFIFGTGLFCLCEFLCAFSHSFLLMVLLRFMQGIGGGIIIPVGMTMLYRVFDPSEYANITSFTFLPALLAPAFAPAMGGLILHFLSWKWIFLFPACLCLIAIIFSLFVLRPYTTEKVQKLDWLGFILISIVLVLSLYTISDFGKHGYSLQSISFTMVVIFLTYYFIRHESTTKLPLFDLQLFNNRLFTQANLIQLVFQICHYASFFAIGLYLQVGVGMSALSTGMIIGAQAIGSMCINRFAVKLFNKYGPGTTILIGFVIIGIFTATLLLINRPELFWIACVLMFCRGLGSGMCGLPMQIASVLGFEKSQFSQASAIFNIVRQIAITLGIALASFVISTTIHHHSEYVLGSGRLDLHSFYWAFYLILISAIIGIGLCASVNDKQALVWVGE